MGKCQARTVFTELLRHQVTNALNIKEVKAGTQLILI